MHLTSLITAAGLAVSTTSAFLLPFPDPSEADTVTTLPVPLDTDFKVQVPEAAEAQKLELPCPGCPVRVGHHKGKDAKIKTDIPSHLELSFNIEHGVDHDRFMVNDFELYPHSATLKDTLGAQVRPDHKEGGKGKLPGHRKQHQPFIQPLGYALGTTPVAKSTEDDLELVQLNLQIIEVGNVFVDGVPSIEVKIIKTPEGGLMIGGIETGPSEPLQKTPMDKPEDCTTMLCRWKAMLSGQMGRFRGHCGGSRRPSHAVDEQEEDVHQRPHSGHSQAPHGQQHRHRFTHLLRNIAMHILLPVAVGVVAGITASILGMLVGTAIVFVWRKLFRSGSAGTRRHHHRSGHSTHKAASTEASGADEKAGLMSNQEEVEAPPAYVEEGLMENNKTTEDQA
ncbi:hypothetical protein TruAng_000129 [Truncatella angustata]|nr:hypothetical protein TruAng_000129 [Truncatella angustata]